jgi:hypothetical protein
MELAFPWPMSDGEWLAWSAAAVTALIGLAMLIAPRLALRALALAPVEGRGEGLSAARATMAGQHLGLGIASILLAQPLVYLALGLAWAFCAFGRIISMLSDGAASLRNVAFLVVELALAALALAFALSIVA